MLAFPHPPSVLRHPHGHQYANMDADLFLFWQQSRLAIRNMKLWKKKPYLKIKNLTVFSLPNTLLPPLESKGKMKTSSGCNIRCLSQTSLSHCYRWMHLKCQKKSTFWGWGNTNQRCNNEKHRLTGEINASGSPISMAAPHLPVKGQSNALRSLCILSRSSEKEERERLYGRSQGFWTSPAGHHLQKPPSKQ